MMTNNQHISYHIFWPQNVSEILFRKTLFSVSDVAYAAHNQFMHDPENLFWLISTILKLLGIKLFGTYKVICKKITEISKLENRDIEIQRQKQPGIKIPRPKKPYIKVLAEHSLLSPR